MRCGFNLTEAAQELHTSQSGISRQIRELEVQIGLQLFKRSGKRLTGLTAPGQRLLPIVARILEHESQLRKVSRNTAPVTAGLMRIAATHTQARYTLPNAVLAFKALHPKVELHIHQGSAQQVAELVRHREVDIGIGTDALAQCSDLVTLACEHWTHTIIVPQGHALDDGQLLTLERLARYRIVTHEFGWMGHEMRDRLSAVFGVVPQGLTQEMDADVIKTYVRQGLGVGVIASIAFDPQRDAGLVALNAAHLFAPSATRLAVRQGVELYPFQRDFIQLLVPHLSAQALLAEIRAQSASS